MFFFDNKWVLATEQAFIELNLIIHSLFEAGVEVKRLEIHNLLAVEDHRAICRPDDLISTVFAQTNGPCLDYVISTYAIL